jgi:hypothetical protein
MKWFGRTSGYYLFWTGFVYFWVGIFLAFTQVARPEIATLGFVLALSVPLWCPPVARYFNMEPVMFNLFGKKDRESKDNVYTLPTPKVVPPVPEVSPPVKEKDPVTFYRLGLTDNNRVSFHMGYTEITMNAAGCQQMINQLEFFKSQLCNDDGDGGPDDPDGGEPVPVPEKKAA